MKLHVVALALLWCAWPGLASAQLKGHYIPGFSGLQNGTQPPPGISVFLPLYLYPTDTIKDDDGHTLGAHPSITATFVGPGVLWVTNTRIAGGRLGVQAIPITFLKSRIESNSLDVSGQWGFSDIYLQPLQLGWEKPRVDCTVGWGFFVPTGKWSLGADDNAGLGMWSNDFQAGATLRLDARHAWTTSMLATYEIHTHKQHTNLKAGSILTFEGGTGRAFYQAVEGSTIPRIVNVGLAYYAQFKVTSDAGTGPTSDELLAGHRDRVYGVGGEAGIFLPKSGVQADLRVVPEFGARNRTQGITYVLTLAYQVKSSAEPSHE